MSNTRREFLQSSAALALGMVGGAATTLAAETPAPPVAAPTPAPPQLQVPKVKFGNVEISRIVLGHNQFCGYAHFTPNLSRDMTAWYTQDQVCAVMHRASSFGINAYNYSQGGAQPDSAERTAADWARFVAEGGKMYVISVDSNQDAAGTASLVRTLQPLALQRHGGVVDNAFREGKMDSVREWCMRARDLGVMVGVGAHNPRAIEYVEEKGWDVDFYSGAVYQITRTPDEWRQVLHGEIMEMPSEIYLQSDPARMYSVIRQTSKPCFAFKVLAAGRVADDGIEQALRTAFSSIKPTDAIYLGIYPRYKDELAENVALVHKILSAS